MARQSRVRTSVERYRNRKVGRVYEEGEEIDGRGKNRSLVVSLKYRLEPPSVNASPEHD